jgi:transposase
MTAATTTATTTAAATATAGAILALDLGKYKTVACAYQARSALAHFHTIPTSRQELRKLFTRAQPAVVVFEACALAGWVLDLCQEVGLAARVANTASEAWKRKHAKRKTDKDDALRLAQLQALGQLPTVALPAKPTREWRALIAARQAVVGRRVALQNRIRSLLVGQGLPAPRGHRAWTAVGLQGLAGHAKALADCGPDELWRGLLELALAELLQARQRLGQLEDKLDALAARDEGVRVLETVPGVGPRTAEAIAAHRHQPRRFANGKQVSAYAGLVPRQYQSGETDHRGRITRRGPGLRRKLLVECAWAMLRYNAWARAVYARPSHGGKTRRKQAIVAVARKLLVRCWAMLRDGRPWRSDPAPAPAAAPA